MKKSKTKTAKVYFNSASNISFSSTESSSYNFYEFLFEVRKKFFFGFILPLGLDVSGVYSNDLYFGVNT